MKSENFSADVNSQSQITSIPHGLVAQAPYAVKDVVGHHIDATNKHFIHLYVALRGEYKTSLDQNRLDDFSSLVWQKLETFDLDVRVSQENFHTWVKKEKLNIQLNHLNGQGQISLLGTIDVKGNKAIEDLVTDDMSELQSAFRDHYTSPVTDSEMIDTATRHDYEYANLVKLVVLRKPGVINDTMVKKVNEAYYRGVLGVEEDQNKSKSQDNSPAETVVA